MRAVALGCVVFLMGAWFGFYEAHAASDIKIDVYLKGKKVPSKSAEYVNGYVAGNYDTLAMTVYLANQQPKYFTPEYFTKQYLCLQKIPTEAETVAWAKPYWSKEPDVAAAEEITFNACEYGASSRANTMTKTGAPARLPAGKHTITK